MNSNSVICGKCNGYLPGHATGGFDLCSCVPLARFSPLDCGCPNLIAHRLGEAAMKTAESKDAGDLIDRGLILLRLLKEQGFVVFSQR